MSRRRGSRLFALLVLTCVVVAGLSVASAVREGDAGPVTTTNVLLASRDERRPALLFRNLNPKRTTVNGRIAVADLSSRGKRTLVPLRCDRVHFNGGRGLCVVRGSGFAAGYQVRAFGPDLRVRETFGIAGIPSRARVSPDGRYGSVTMFVSGHSYADAGQFSTQTTIIDLARNGVVADLEQFAVTRDGARVTADDVNFWGVTFGRDSDRFYATLGTGGKTYLIAGSVSRREAWTIHANVECPSLSPDGTRIAFKRRIADKARVWRLTVLDLGTMRETPVSETRGVDDQVEWLDDGRLLYGIEGSIWTVPADGSGGPTRFSGAGESPAVVRW